MKKLLLAICMVWSITSLCAQDTTALKFDPSKKSIIVEAACGQCQFQMKGKGCTLAVRIKGKSYFVEKTHIDAYGDAHETEGFCNAISKAKVQGQIVGGKFIASYFELIGAAPAKK